VPMSKTRHIIACSEAVAHLGCKFHHSAMTAARPFFIGSDHVKTAERSASASATCGGQPCVSLWASLCVTESYIK